MLKKNIFLTGALSSGKTTVIKKIVDALNKQKIPAAGFYTEEERQGDRRVGFLMRTLDAQNAYLAHQDIESDYHIRRYGVDIQNIETLAVGSIIPKEGHIIILDEIGKMECFSEKFKAAALKALDAPNIVIGTVTFGGDEFIQKIKKREDVDILEVTLDNRDKLPGIILGKIQSIQN